MQHGNGAPMTMTKTRETSEALAHDGQPETEEAVVASGANGQAKAEEVVAAGGATAAATNLRHCSG